MAWNDKNKGGAEPPEIDEVINKFKEKFKNINRAHQRKNGSGDNNDGGMGGFSIPSGKIVKSLLIVLVLVWLASGFYIIDSGERGVVLRFGQFQKQTGAGPHWHLPYPIERKIVVKVDEVRSEKIGFRNVALRNRNVIGNVSSESLMLTKDENIIDSKFEVQYKIKNARDYLFNVANPHNTLKQVTESAIRLIVGRNAMDYIITEGRSDVVANIQEQAQALLDEYKTGLDITNINMLDAQAPEPVQAAFSDVVKAREDKTRLVNEAETYANGILPQARGEAARMLEEARAYRSRVVSKADGEANRFNQIREQYEKAPDVTKKRLYLETIESVLTNTSKVIVDSNSNNVMYLPIDKLGINRTTESSNYQSITPKEQKGNAPDRSVRNLFRNREIR